MSCSICGQSDGFPYTCKFCSAEFCSVHRLPEGHDCDGLRKWKEERSEKKFVYPPFQKEKKHESGKFSLNNETMIKVGIMLLLLAALAIFVVMK